MRDLLTTWTEETIASNYELYAGDKSNPEIMLKYLIEASGEDGLVSELTVGMMSSAVTVSRLKNQLLNSKDGKLKDLDCRVKNISTGRMQQSQLFTIRDLMSPNEAKIVKYIDEHNAWDFSPSRIKKSIRGIDKIDIECVLRNKDKYLETETSFNGVDGVSSDMGRHKQ